MIIEIQNKSYKIMDMYTTRYIEGAGIVVVGTDTFDLVKNFTKGRIKTDAGRCVLECDFFISKVHPNRLLTRNHFSNVMAETVCRYHTRGE